ncbi:MAG: xylulokinase [Eubacteriales bacterium]|nr:xylulokinase [Eubacteriales bacterium]
MEYLLAHDLGTSGDKATLFSADGRMIASQTEHYPTAYSNGSWAEQNPEDWWRAVIATTRKMLEHVDPAQIAAVSFSGQMMGCVCVDAQGEAVRPAVIWADMRAVAQQETIARRISARDFYHLTGHRLSPSYGGQKLMWIRENEPEAYRKTAKMLNAKDYVIHKLTGAFATEYTDASSTCLLELDRLQWSDTLLEVMGIERQKLPELRGSAETAGGVTPQAAALTGLLAGTPVVCGGGDGVCAAIGTGCVEEGVAHSSMGTSSWISITSRKAIYDDEQRTFNWAHIVPGYVLPTGTMQCGGGAYGWYVENFCRHEAQQAQARGLSVYDVLEELLAKSPVGSRGLLFLPYLLGERSPRWNADARGAFVGITMEHGTGDFLRAVQEGVAMNLKVVLDIFRNSGQQIQEMTVVGGGVNSASWQRILADVYDVKILLPTWVDEAASMGAAVTAGVGVGLFDDFSACRRFLEVRRTVEPRPETVEKYARLSAVFEETYRALTPVFSQLKDFQNGK